jgi:hypothetical protein
MKEMQNSPSINQSSKKMAKRGVNKMMEWEKKRQAKLEKLKQEKIEREKSQVILPKASKQSKKILMKRKKQLKKEKEAQKKLLKLQREEEHNNIRDNDLGEAIQNNINNGSDDDDNNNKMSPTSAAARRLFRQAKEQQLRKQELANAMQFSHSPKLVSRSKNYKYNNNDDNNSNSSNGNGRNKINVSDRLYRLPKQRELKSYQKQIMKEQLEAIDDKSGRELFKPKINKKSEKIVREKLLYDWQNELPVEDRLYTTGIKYNQKKEKKRIKHEQMIKAKMQNKHISLNSEILASRRDKQRSGPYNKNINPSMRFERPIGNVKQSTLNSIVKPTFQPNVDTNDHNSDYGNVARQFNNKRVSQ